MVEHFWVMNDKDELRNKEVLEVIAKCRENVFRSAFVPRGYLARVESPNMIAPSYNTARIQETTIYRQMVDRFWNMSARFAEYFGKNLMTLRYLVKECAVSSARIILPVVIRLKAKYRGWNPGHYWKKMMAL